MFGRKKANKLIEDIDRYFDLMDQSVLAFKDGVRNYLYSNNDDFNGNLKKMTEFSKKMVAEENTQNNNFNKTYIKEMQQQILMVEIIEYIAKLQLGKLLNPEN